MNVAIKKELSIFLQVCVTVLLLLCCLGCDLCDNEKIKEIPSPTAKYKIVIFQRSCGATTGFTTQISVIENDKELSDEAGNIFIADTNNDRAPVASWGGPEVKAFWIGNNKISVHYNKNARVSKEKRKIYNIDIKYIKNL